LNDCSTLDHCNLWIFDASIDMAKTSWGGVPKFAGGVPLPQRCLDKTQPLPKFSAAAAADHDDDDDDDDDGDNGDMYRRCI